LFRGRSSRCFRLAEQRVIKAFQHMNAMRAVRKDRFKQLCDERIDAACAQHGIPGKMLVDGLGRMNIQLNRKMLQQLAIYEPYSFKSLTDLVKQYHSELGIVPPNAEPPAPVVTRAPITQNQQRHQRQHDEAGSASAGGELAEFEAAWCQLESFLSNLLHNDDYDRILLRSLRRHFDAAVASRSVNRLTPAGARRLFDSLRRDICAGAFKLSLADAPSDAVPERRVDDETEKASGEDVSGKASDDDDDAAGNSEEADAAKEAEPSSADDDDGENDSDNETEKSGGSTKADTIRSKIMFEKSSGTRKIIKKRSRTLAEEASNRFDSPGRFAGSSPAGRSAVHFLSASDFDNRAGDDADLTPEERQKARALQDCLCRILTKIKRLQQLEMSLNDLSSESSVYLQEDRLKQRAVQPVPPSPGPPIAALLSGRRFRYDCSAHPEIGELIECYVNRRRGFPDLPKVLKIVNWCNRPTNWAGLRPRSGAALRPYLKMLASSFKIGRQPGGRPREADADLRQRLERNARPGQRQARLGAVRLLSHAGGRRRSCRRRRRRRNSSSSDNDDADESSDEDEDDGQNDNKSDGEADGEGNDGGAERPDDGANGDEPGEKDRDGTGQIGEAGPQRIKNPAGDQEAEQLIVSGQDAVEDQANDSDSVQIVSLWQPTKPSDSSSVAAKAKSLLPFCRPKRQMHLSRPARPIIDLDSVPPMQPRPMPYSASSSIAASTAAGTASSGRIQLQRPRVLGQSNSRASQSPLPTAQSGLVKTSWGASGRVGQPGGGFSLLGLPQPPRIGSVSSDSVIQID
uniref:Bromo domain-containing protein n=1 Tax=Macrostomum lignano TaxID=282301 RepID=A0A1I8GDL9_9PLAT